MGIDKNKIFKQIRKQNENTSITPETVCIVLYSFYNTHYFSKLNTDLMNDEFENATSFAHFTGIEIRYDLIVPGKILTTNASIVTSDTLTWKVDGMRILFNDTILTATYLWTFILTGFVVAIAFSSLIFLLKRKYNSKS